MAPRPPVATRLMLLAYTLATASALTLSACGDGGGATAESTPTTASKQRVEAAPARPCPAKLSALVDSLGRLRRQLAVGLSYEQYAARIKALRASYDAVPIDHLTFDCLRATGTPAERAFNKYIDAANAWGECLADAACTTAAIEPVLQGKWRVASRVLSKSQ